MTERELAAMARRHAARAIEVLVAIMLSPKAPEDVRAQAAIEILERLGRHVPSSTIPQADDLPTLDPAIIDRLLH